MCLFSLTLSFVVVIIGEIINTMLIYIFWLVLMPNYITKSFNTFFNNFQPNSRTYSEAVCDGYLVKNRIQLRWICAVHCAPINTFHFVSFEISGRLNISRYFHFYHLPSDPFRYDLYIIFVVLFVSSYDMQMSVSESSSVRCRLFFTSSSCHSFFFITKFAYNWYKQKFFFRSFFISRLWQTKQSQWYAHSMIELMFKHERCYWTYMNVSTLRL